RAAHRAASPPRRPSDLAGAMTANIASYLLQLLAGRWLGVAGYSEFASLLAVQLLCAVPALALQNVVARELVHGSDIAALRALRRDRKSTRLNSSHVRIS